MIDATVIAVSRMLNWSDIVADRFSRGLKTAGERKPKVLKASPFLPDPRLLSNVKPHVEIVYSGDRSVLTPARAARIRKEKYAACGCRLCALALNPPQTFADAERFGITHQPNHAEINALLDDLRAKRQATIELERSEHAAKDAALREADDGVGAAEARLEVAKLDDESLRIERAAHAERCPRIAQ